MGFRRYPDPDTLKLMEFSSGGDTDTHTEKSHIALMLQEINSRHRDAGHIPDLDKVLLDKVAIDFGLIGTGQGVLIPVVKNLRMCSDCHSFAKLVSRIYDREIFVPDDNGFHFFCQQGLCSCSDYW
ncbi:putative DYW domain-containing protein [Rosa chinensis]|uniref:Putative DYW domain-containing protein n=1 Tax=Rosa chinensis TaxID=74649 RepID=A0A2P6QP87_ROSCH|nr:putative DYW domain-containing protein [Rosa chinensis]